MCTLISMANLTPPGLPVSNGTCSPALNALPPLTPSKICATLWPLLNFTSPLPPTCALASTPNCPLAPPLALARCACSNGLPWLPQFSSPYFSARAFLQSRANINTLAVAAVDAHLRSLQPGHLTDVQSSDQHTVKPWFDGKVNFAPTVSDFANDGFPLLGGRLDVLSGNTAAALVYGRRKHIINVFVLPSVPRAPSTSANDSGERDGYHWLSWQQNGFTYIAVSDATPSDLEQLRTLLQRKS